MSLSGLEPLSPPPPFSDTEHTNNFVVVSQNVDEHDQAPAYSFYPSTHGSCFELKTIGKRLNRKEKYLCGDILDNRYFLLGSSNGLEFIDFSLPSEQQIPERLIEAVRFKQIVILITQRYSALIALAGKNNHIRTYNLSTLRLLIKSKQISRTPRIPRTPKSPNSHGRARSVDSIYGPDFTPFPSTQSLRRSVTLESLNTTLNNTFPNADSSVPVSNASSTTLPVSFNQNTNQNTNPISISTSPTTYTSHTNTSLTSNRRNINQNQLSLKINSNLSTEVRNANFSAQWTLDYSKLPGTKMALSFVARSGPTRTYLTVMSKQNIFLFELDFGDVDRKPEFIHTRTYWLPQTPKFIQLCMHEDQLVDIVAVFHSEVILIGVDDARVREVSVDPKLQSGSHNLISLPSFINEASQWQTFSQLPWIPTLDPEFVSENFTIPPPYDSTINADPSTMLNPIPIFETGSIDSLQFTSDLHSLFFATFGTKSMIVDSKGRPFSTIVFQWTFIPLHLEFLKSTQPNGESYVVGFGKNMIEIRSINNGRIVENVVRGADVQYLGKGINGQGIIWGCSCKGIKGITLYRLEGPRI
ncbi:ste/ste20 protein kinase [Gigaspora margarita]|uniref:Ste/ste20 protein kinase n=1 Tax=Gigaspora margarita TaxID=4874 RepID=A0A8H3XAQ5_GIGMA|nr:ste/ste20 protein kinase [Gigaspora margarita]